MKSPSERQKGELLLLHLVWLNFCLPYSGLYLQDFLAFLLSQAKEVFYASPRICSSVQNKKEPPAHFEKHFCLFLALQKVTMVLKTFLNDIVEKRFWSCCVRIWRQLLRWCETISLSLVFNLQFRTKYLTSFTNQNVRFHSIMWFYLEFLIRSQLLEVQSKARSAS